MSIQAIAWALKVPDISSGSKFVLVVLSNYADEDGECWPSQARIARDTNMGERTIRDHLKELEAAGLIARKERRTDGGAKRTSDLFMLVWRQNSPVEKTYRQKTSEPTGRKRQNLPAESAREPSLEPSIEPSVHTPPPKEGDGDGKSKKKSTKPVENLSDRDRATFETTFWPAYRKLGRPNNPHKPALEAWAAAVVKRKVDPEVILAGLQRFIAYVDERREREGERFQIEGAVCHATTWLNQHRWEDDYGTAAALAPLDPAKMTVAQRWEFDFVAWVRAGRDPKTEPQLKDYPGL